MQPEFGEGKLINIKKESGCHKKDEDVPEEVTQSKKKVTLMELLEIFHNMKVQGKNVRN